MAKKRCLAAALALLPLLALAAELPRKAPEYTINRNGAQPLALSQYKGKPVVLAFILTYCSHCQRTVGFLIKDQNEYGPRGLQVVACAIENGAQLAVPAFLKNFSPPFPVGYNDGSTALDFMQHSMVRVPIMPMLAFIDRQGMIRAQFEGDDEKFFGEQHEQNLKAQIEALLKVGVAKKAAAGPRK
ncbi:MAG: TlpA disulfide reductase family protein [Bryobacteraceae bacterium]|jgi:thiol-disulfide isomerase/thioredoxin